MTPAPVVEEHSGVLVVRDDLVLGGTKRRFCERILQGQREVVYASPCSGAAQMALAITGAAIGVRVTIVCAARQKRHPHTLVALEHGADLLEVRPGYMSVVQARAREYAHTITGATLLPFGLMSDEIVEMIGETAREVRERIGAVDEVWCAGGSGTLALGLARGFHDTRVHVVEVGKPLPRAVIEHDRIWVERHTHKQRFEQPTPVALRPPFPSVVNYDAKVWQYIVRRSGRVLLWNVAG